MITKKTTAASQMNALILPETAPRDYDVLLHQSPFVHRRLAEELHARGFKCWSDDNPQDKTNFIRSSPEHRTAVLLYQLHVYDISRGVTDTTAGDAISAARRLGVLLNFFCSDPTRRAKLLELLRLWNNLGGELSGLADSLTGEEQG